MRINIEGNGVSAKNSPEHSPRCIDVSTHLCGRTVESSARHWPARDKTHDDGERAAYISVSVNAKEFSFEAPASERAPESYARNCTEQSTYLDIEDARKLRDALTEALDCADVK